jgi:hypothetical protein
VIQFDKYKSDKDVTELRKIIDEKFEDEEAKAKNQFDYKPEYLKGRKKRKDKIIDELKDERPFAIHKVPAISGGGEIAKRTKY